MRKQCQLLLLTGASILAVALAVWPGHWSPSAYANVTLVSFTATTRPGQPEIDIKWETATEFGTVGFFVTRSNSAGGIYERVSDFIQHTGDTVVGAQYAWTDRNIVLNRPYWYQLEEITQNQDSNFYGPISVTLSFTPTPTATPTTQPATTVVKATTPSQVVATQRLATGATVTPRPTLAGSSANPTALGASSTLSSGAKNSPPAATATSLPADSNLPAAATAVSLSAANVAQAPEPAITSTSAVHAAAAPAVVVTEAPPLAANSSGSSPALILMAAAILFLGIAFLILRQARH